MGDPGAYRLPGWCHARVVTPRETLDYHRGAYAAARYSYKRPIRPSVSGRVRFATRVLTQRILLSRVAVQEHLEGRQKYHEEGAALLATQARQSDATTRAGTPQGDVLCESSTLCSGGDPVPGQVPAGVGGVGVASRPTGLRRACSYATGAARTQNPRTAGATLAEAMDCQQQRHRIQRLAHALTRRATNRRTRYGVRW